MLTNILGTRQQLNFPIGQTLFAQLLFMASVRDVTDQEICCKACYVGNSTASSKWMYKGNLIVTYYHQEQVYWGMDYLWFEGWIGYGKVMEFNCPSSARIQQLSAWMTCFLTNSGMEFLKCNMEYWSVHICFSSLVLTSFFIPKMWYNIG